MLDDFRSNQEVQNKRDFHGADLVVYLTGVDYFFGSNNVFGYALDLTLDPTRAYCVVETSTATNNGVGLYVFAHEVAHLLGCNHQPPITGNDFEWAHAHKFNILCQQARQTIVHTQSEVPILHYSNPQVKYIGIPTGVENTRDNARQLRSAACTVAVHKTNVNSPIKAKIAGADVGCVCEDAYVWAVASGGAPGNLSYAWQISNGGFIYGPILSTDVDFSFQLSCIPGDGTFVRLTVTDASNNSTHNDKLIVAEEGSVCDRNDQVAATHNVKSILNITPNPNKGNFQIEYSLLDDSDAIIQIVSADGKVLKTLSKAGLQNELHTFDISMDFPFGIYFCRLLSGSSSLTRHFVISK